MTLRKDIQELVCLFFTDGRACEMRGCDIPSRLMPALAAGLDQGLFQPLHREVATFSLTLKGVGETGCCGGVAATEAQPKHNRGRTGRRKKAEAPADALIIGAIRTFHHDGGRDDPPRGIAIARKAAVSANTVKNFLKKRFGEFGQEKFEACWRRGEIGDKLAEWEG